MSLLDYTWQSGLKYTDIKIQILQNKDLNLPLESIIRPDFSSLMVYRYMNTEENKKNTKY